MQARASGGIKGLIGGGFMDVCRCGMATGLIGSNLVGSGRRMASSEAGCMPVRSPVEVATREWASEVNYVGRRQ